MEHVVSDEMIQMVLDEAAEAMSEAVTHVRREFSTVRTGRDSSSLVEKIMVNAYARPGSDLRPVTGP